MADAKISALTNLTAADAINDMIPIVDVSDTPPASGNTKRISINNLLSSSPTASGALTVTGLVTAGSATITGDLTVRTTGLKVTSTGVGVGTASPLSVFTAQSQASARLSVRTTDAVFGSIAGGTAFDSLNGSDASLVPFGCRGSTISFGSSGGGIGLQLDASNNVNVALGNVVMGTSGKGIDFSAVTGGTGTATANVLNDYEEGTFTPTVTSEFGTIGTTTVTSATYTKIGRLVSINFDISIITAGTGSGSLLVSVPFNIGEEACGAGRETAIVGNMCQVFRQSATAVGVRFYNNLTPIANLNRFFCSYTYSV
jgi:hypothetical protein